MKGNSVLFSLPLNAHKALLAVSICILVVACGPEDNPNPEPTASVSLAHGMDSVVAPESPGPELPANSLVSWTYIIQNTGNGDLVNVTLADEQRQPSIQPEEQICEWALLKAGERVECVKNGVVALGQQQIDAKVNAQTKAGEAVGANLSSYYVGIDESALSARPSVTPTSGPAPLTVTFTPSATTDNSIVVYEWDFDGDGTFDISETVGRNQSFTFSEPGSYTATLRVTDNAGGQASADVTISVGNQPPLVAVQATPSNGQIPLTVTFMATAEDADGIVRYEWDFDGDNTYDATTDVGSATHLYEQPGRYQAQVRVTDGLSAVTEIKIPTLTVNALPVGSPSVEMGATPVDGTAPLDVTFTASAVDPDGDAIERYEWDFDGDGAIDATTEVGQSSYVYGGIGTFFPRVTVFSADGQQAADAEKIFVEPEVELTLSTDTLDPYSEEGAVIATTLRGATTVSVIIQDRAGRLVRTLVPSVRREAGDYEDVWDGQDNSGVIVSEGAYHAVVLYQLDGATEQYNLALTTGGIQSNPPRSDIPPGFSPFAGDPLEIEFTLDRASEVTAFMGLYNIDTRLVTFLQREPLGRGKHVIVWNGENSEGQLIEPPPGDSFLFGIFAYTLPDNAIFVRSGVHVSAVSAAPSIFQPLQSGPEGSSASSRISFELNRAGSAKVTVNDVKSGIPVAEFTRTGLAAGANTVMWDGRDNNGELVAAGDYRIGVAGIDDKGHQSLTVYALQRIFY